MKVHIAMQGKNGTLTKEPSKNYVDKKRQVGGWRNVNNMDILLLKSKRKCQPGVGRQSRKSQNFVNVVFEWLLNKQYIKWRYFEPTPP